MHEQFVVGHDARFCAEQRISVIVIRMLWYSWPLPALWPLRRMFVSKATQAGAQILKKFGRENDAATSELHAQAERTKKQKGEGCIH